MSMNIELIRNSPSARVGFQVCNRDTDEEVITRRFYRPRLGTAIQAMIHDSGDVRIRYSTPVHDGERRAT